MDFDFPGEDDPRRVAVRSWLADHPEPTPRQLAEAGYVAPQFPPPYGLGADAIHQLIIGEELRRAEVTMPDNPIGIGWAAPTLVAAGTEEQKARYLPPALSGEEYWCQLFSEPDAGSDLASLRTTAVLDGDEWIINGQKIWTTWAEKADFGILLARTDPMASKQKGISYFICPMKIPGIEVRAIIEMAGGRHFNEVFLDDVRIPADCVVGTIHDGWRLAKITLGNERVTLSEGGVLWGMGPETTELLDLARRHTPLADLDRDSLVSLYIEAEVMRLLGLKIVSQLVSGREPGPEAAVKKILADRHGQRVMQAAKRLSGAGGLTTEEGPFGEEPGEWPWGFHFSPALTIGGGTSQVLRNIIGERILGLPRD
jgi:alkylation response protein AidB-like acyl-CoA dehydrogenase